MTRQYATQLALAITILQVTAMLCWAATSATPISGTPLPNATAPITRLRSMYRTSTSLTFSSNLTYIATSLKTGKPEARHLDIYGELSKPNMFVYRSPRDGAIASDGVWTIAEDSSLTHYSRYPSTRGFALGKNWYFVSHHVLKGNTAILNYSMVGYLFQHINDQDFLQPQTMTITGTMDTVAGRQVQDVEYKDVSTDVHLYFDPAAGTLTGAETTYYVAGGQTFEVRENVTKLTLSTSALPAADFTTAPPPGAINVPIPLSKVAKPKSHSARPSRHSSNKVRWRNVGGVWVYM